MFENIKTVDGHVHTFSSDEIAKKIIKSFNKVYSIDFNVPGEGTIEDLIQGMNLTGIDYSVMANFAPPKILDSNNMWTIEMSKLNQCLIPLVSFHPDMGEDILPLLEKYISEGAKGIKFHNMAQGFMPTHPALEPLYDYCNQIAFPIEFHCGRVSNARLNEFSDVECIIPVIDKYQDIPIILTHMADGNIDDVIKLSKEYENLYFDTSIVISGYPDILETNEPSWLDDDVVVDVINTIGAERLLFGSDYPWGSPSHDFDRIANLDLNYKEKSLILGGNAIRIFGISA
ncbi:amidohydrolase family protein [Acetivibrio saccincola]|uniref:Amidohydrolase n=1 Tax=Acetivibrio saccincola TaxID=1677857 RepID=A0A2K9EG77_9FIRM|nr:amidohydrolase family protein [Acetivibrio saccincola]AUG56913.1 Amidohydrolase [Acetivibrio saccincola]NLW27744.1 amidohydrolase family protein [Acetivibrio saccincola]PQQ66941.1 amidohydrolase [Acetivibrio saccincola]HQD28688.1 amidohydrolase family protein [Acetivibrio saccincola]